MSTSTPRKGLWLSKLKLWLVALTLLPIPANGVTTFHIIVPEEEEEEPAINRGASIDRFTLDNHTTSAIPTTLDLDPSSTASPNQEEEEEESPTQEEEEDTEGGDCRILALLQLSSKEGAGHQAAAELARRHFNERNTDIVPELRELLDDESCAGIQLGDFYFRDTTGKDDAMVALSALQELQQQPSAASASGGGSRRVVCGVLGPESERGIQVLSGSTQLLDMPHVTFGVAPTVRTEFPSVVSTRYPLKILAKAVAEYLQAGEIFGGEGVREFSKILYDDEAFEVPLQLRGEDELDLDMSSSLLMEPGKDSVSEEAFEDALEDGKRTIILHTTRPEWLEEIADYAADYDLLGPGWLWIISATALSPGILHPTAEEPFVVEKDSNLAQLLNGAAVYVDEDPFLLQPDKDKFLKSWKKQQRQEEKEEKESASLVEVELELGAGEDDDVWAPPLPATYSSFVYDAVMLLGLSACNNNKNNSTNNITRSEQMLLTQFHGASGWFQFGGGEEEEDDDDSGSGSGSSSDSGEDDDESGSGSKEEEEESGSVDEDRSGSGSGSEDEGATSPVMDRYPGKDGALFGMYNIRLQDYESEGGDEEEEGGPLVAIIPVLTSIYSDGDWARVENEAFIYKDGTTTPPMPLRTTEDYNYLDKGVVIAGLCTMCFALILTIGSGVWVYRHRGARLVASGQQEFLYLLCFGASMLAASIAFVSFDDSDTWGLTPERLSGMCAAFPWFSVGGYLCMFCALTGKLWRINKIILNPLRRQRVQVYQALWPFGFLAACVVVLVCWQLIDPYMWKRIELNDDPLETIGKCTSENPLPYILILGLLLAVVIILLLVSSWKARGAQEELSESKWIFAGVFSHLQLWVVGIPLHVILDNDSSNSSYLIKVALAFLFSTVMVSLVIWPRAYWMYAPMDNSSTTTRVRVTIGGSKDTSKIGSTTRNGDDFSYTTTTNRISCTGNSGEDPAVITPATLAASTVTPAPAQDYTAADPIEANTRRMRNGALQRRDAVFSTRGVGLGHKREPINSSTPSFAVDTNHHLSSMSMTQESSGREPIDSSTPSFTVASNHHLSSMSMDKMDD